MGDAHGELAGVRVLDASPGLAGAYCAKLLADAGADVVRVEPVTGDPMRRWRWGADVPEGEDGVLFRYLRHGQRSVLAPEVDRWLAGAHVVLVGAPDSPSVVVDDAASLRAAHPGLVVVATSVFGLDGPWAGRPGTEFTAQAESGGLSIRGGPERPPIQAGGRVVEWVTGGYAAVATLAALRSAQATGQGELIDVAMLDIANLTCTVFNDLFQSLAGRPPFDPAEPSRAFETPSIEPTADGYVGFNTNTRDQFDAFCVLIERPDLLEDDSWALLNNRVARRVEWNEIVRAWTTQHTTAEIVEAAALLRIPVAPVSDPPSVLGLEQATARHVFGPDPTGTFTMPRRPWTIDGEPPPAPRPAPGVGAHGGETWTEVEPVAPSNPRPGPGELPLTGLKVLDLTAWWAGPSSTALLAGLGADVVHVESTRRMDGMRMTGIHRLPQWWERSAFFLQANANKRDLTLDLDDERGRALLLRLVADADVVVENFTPRVLEAFHLGWDVVHATNPRAVMVRMPAFGLTGPWRDRPGFAQTMEQITGLAWVTGHLDDQPRIQRGPCDPNGGVHAAFATLVALVRRDRTGEGCLVEASMFEAALNVAAEPVLEWAAYGNVVERAGNRGPEGAPQNLYACAGRERWLALAVVDDDQWQALTEVMGRADLAGDPTLATVAGRREALDRLDAEVAAWAATRDRDEVVEALVAAGVPAGRSVDPRASSDHPQYHHRGTFEPVTHPIAGTHPTMGLPFRFAGVDRWVRHPAPTLGQHSREILVEQLGLTPEAYDELEAAGVTGTWPQGMPR
jgi:crotonobetainyl-CoA:carnitine CoA-transferase CaiB-like acyl-CoA transferase